MPFSISGETRDHGTPTPKAWAVFNSRLGRFAFIASLVSGCVSLKTHNREVKKAYETGYEEGEFLPKMGLRTCREELNQLSRLLESTGPEEDPVKPVNPK